MYAQAIWPEAYERTAQRHCREAMIDDLRTLSHEQPVVVLIDQFERGKGEIESWGKQLVAALIDEAARFGPFVLAIASTERPLPLLESQLADRQTAGLHRIEGLSVWRDEHIEQWLQLERLRTQEDLIGPVRTLIDSGTTPQTLRVIAANIRASQQMADG
jgi:hypothetical protein